MQRLRGNSGNDAVKFVKNIAIFAKKALRQSVLMI